MTEYSPTAQRKPVEQIKGTDPRHPQQTEADLAASKAYGLQEQLSEEAWGAYQDVYSVFADKLSDPEKLADTIAPVVETDSPAREIDIDSFKHEIGDPADFYLYGLSGEKRDGRQTLYTSPIMPWTDGANPGEPIVVSLADAQAAGAHLQLDSHTAPGSAGIAFIAEEGSLAHLEKTRIGLEFGRRLGADLAAEAYARELARQQKMQSGLAFANGHGATLATEVHARNHESSKSARDALRAAATGNDERAVKICRSFQTSEAARPIWDRMIDQGLVEICRTHQSDGAGLYRNLHTTLEQLVIRADAVGVEQFIKDAAEPHISRNGETRNRLRCERLFDDEYERSHVLLYMQVSDDPSSEATFSFAPPEKPSGVVVRLDELGRAVEQVGGELLLDTLPQNDFDDASTALSRIAITARGISPDVASKLELQRIPINLFERLDRGLSKQLGPSELIAELDYNENAAAVADLQAMQLFQLERTLPMHGDPKTPTFADAVSTRKYLDEALSHNPQDVAESLADKEGTISSQSLAAFYKQYGVNPESVLLFALPTDSESTTLYSSLASLLADEDAQRKLGPENPPHVFTMADVAVHSNGSGKLTVIGADDAGITLRFASKPEELAQAQRKDTPLELSKRAKQRRTKWHMPKAHEPTKDSNEEKRAA